MSKNTPEEALPRADSEFSIPIRPVTVTLERAAIKAKARIEKILITAKSNEDREKVEAVLEQILDAHLNAIGMQVGLLIRSTIEGDGETGYALLLNHLQGMLAISENAFKALQAKYDGPAVEVATVGQMPPDSAAGKIVTP
jgi:hypothetical protein